MNSLTGREASKYFLYSDVWKIVIKTFFWVFVTAALGFIFDFYYLYIATIFLLLFAIYMYIGCLRNVPSDDEIDRHYEEFIENTKQKILSYFQIEKNQLVDEIHCEITESPGIKNYKKRHRKGLDGRKRVNTQTFKYFLFLKNRVLFYEVDYNLEEQIESEVETGEYLYKNIHSFETAREGHYLIKGDFGLLKVPSSAEIAISKIKNRVGGIFIE